MEFLSELMSYVHGGFFRRFESGFSLQCSVANLFVFNQRYMHFLELILDCLVFSLGIFLFRQKLMLKWVLLPPLFDQQFGLHQSQNSLEKRTKTPPTTLVT
jgi:hypothetical protein